MEAAHFLVSGRVQGVGFRASARHRALELGLVGYARNLADGRVEAFAQGNREAIDIFAQWLNHGPPLARVDEVRREPVAVRERTGFGWN
ncbi:MAG TPA: acylphosphatase [Xanthomonadaceae bacterium]|jgi:acylphosphatase|nr:acylphosphatase [Xanthomonadaceae bacterium]